MSCREIKATKNSSKKPRRSKFDSDPISNGIRASILSNVNQVYSRIQTFRKTTISKNQFNTHHQSFSLPQKVNAFSCGIQTLQSPKSFSIKKIQRQTPSNSNSKKLPDSPKINLQQNNETIQATKKRSCMNPSIRSMLKERKEFEDGEATKLIFNPYYKIMKRRSKALYSELLPANKNSIVHQNYGKKSKTEYEDTTFCEQKETQLLRSNYCFHKMKQLSSQNNQTMQVEQGVRKKSQTKIYEDIKKYFQQKYVNFRRTEYSQQK